MMDMIRTVLSVLRVPTFFLLRTVMVKMMTERPYEFAMPDSVTIRPAYDFVVVGAGAAGSVVAARLAETGASTLLLEWGVNASPESTIPAFMPLGLGGDKDYNFRMAPQKNSQWAFQNNASFLPQGKMMGGSAALGNLVYSRGNRYDYDNWAALGNTGWDYDSVLPYFKKSENFAGPRSRQADRYHGHRGPFRVEPKHFDTKIGASFLRAGLELGYDVIDENGNESIGFSPMHFGIRDGVKETSAQAYLKPMAGSGRRNNLDILLNARVNKIIFDGNNKAVGVEFTQNGERSVRVIKEVIVCAGVINSPKLLMLSGVGPQSHLSSKGIKVVADVPGVGKNLHDHPSIFNFAHSVNPGSGFSLTNDFTPGNIWQYLRQRTGPLTLPFGEDGGAWVNLGDGNPQWPDVQISCFNVAFSALGEGLISISQALRSEVFQDLLGPYAGGENVMFIPSLLRSKSRGSVTLRSRNVKDDPIVDFNFLSDPEDVKLMVKAIRFAQKIATTRAMRGGVNATYLSKPLRDCNQHTFDNDGYWECFTRHLVTTFYHPVGTCKMAPETDPYSVVCDKLKLRGVTGVRVADSSIMPAINSANPMATTIMIGEKAADLVKVEWGLQQGLQKSLFRGVQRGHQRGHQRLKSGIL